MTHKRPPAPALLSGKEPSIVARVRALRKYSTGIPRWQTANHILAQEFDIKVLNPAILNMNWIRMVRFAKMTKTDLAIPFFVGITPNRLAFDGLHVTDLPKTR
jgi:hypothetical protein